MGKWIYGIIFINNKIHKESDEFIKEFQAVAQSQGGMSTVANLTLLAVFIGNPFIPTFVCLAVFTKFAESFKLGKKSISIVEQEQIKKIVSKLSINKSKEYLEFKKKFIKSE